jgi:hypothetical protein
MTGQPLWIELIESTALLLAYFKKLCQRGLFYTLNPVSANTGNTLLPVAGIPLARSVAQISGRYAIAQANGTYLRQTV